MIVTSLWPRTGFATGARGYLLIMSPRMWRLLIAGSLRLFLISAVPAAAHLSVFAGLLATVIAFVVPAPRTPHQRLDP
ncbi:MAG TPA: hypothetical protein VGL47_40705 [Amycolatopsis sp.]|uniref:hypothetical protein n=1 Tax=Amycolatopsis sp. TaxID=37632 RepID=UPI002F418E59